MFKEIFVANKDKIRDDFFVGGGNANNILGRHRDADDLILEQNSPAGLGEETVLHRSESHQFLTANEPKVR